MAEALDDSGELQAGVQATGLGESELKSLGATMDGMIRLASERVDTLELHSRLAAQMLGLLLARISDWKGQQARGGTFVQISEAIKYIGEHFPELIDFDELLEASSISSTHFRRQFKKQLATAHRSINNA